MGHRRLPDPGDNGVMFEMKDQDFLDGWLKFVKPAIDAVVDRIDQRAGGTGWRDWSPEVSPSA